MPYLLLALFIAILNCFLFYFLKSQNGLKKLLLYIIIYFILAIVFTKIYNLLNIQEMPNGFGFFILLIFSWCIMLLHFIKKLNNRRVNIISKVQIENNHFIQSLTYLKLITITITVFQLYLILTKTINIFKS